MKLFVGCKIKNYESIQPQFIFRGLKYCGNIEADCLALFHGTIRYVVDDDGIIGRNKIKAIRWDVPLLILYPEYGKGWLIPKATIENLTDKGFNYIANGVKNKQLDKVVILQNIKEATE